MPCYDPRGDIHEKWVKVKIEKHKVYLDDILRYLKTDPELMVEYFNYLENEEDISITEITSSVGSIVGSICAFSKFLKTKEQKTSFIKYLTMFDESCNVSPEMWEQWLREHAEVDIAKNLYKNATLEEERYLDSIIPKHIRDEIKSF